MGSLFLHQKAGVVDNGVAASINKHLKRDGRVFSFGWGNLNQDMIGRLITPTLDRGLISRYLDARGQLDVIEQVVKFINQRTNRKVLVKEVLLLNGATSGIALISHYLKNVRGAGSVFVQNPVYDTALNIFRSNRLRIKQVDDVSPSKKDESFAYLIFKLHNPTGASVTDQVKKQMIKKIFGQGRYLIEDDSYGLLESDNQIELINDPGYIYLSSFSKYIHPGLRMGYVIAHPDIISDLSVIQKYLTSHPNIISQLTLKEYLSSGAIEDELIHKRGVVREKRDMFERSLAKLPVREYLKTSGGFYYWFEFPKGTNERSLFEDLLKEGVVTIPGQIYFIKNPRPSLRLSISQIEKDDIADGCDLFCKVVQRHV